MPAVSALPASTRPSGAGSTESSRPSAGLAILLARASERDMNITAHTRQETGDRP